MTRYALIYGAVSGVVIIAGMTLAMALSGGAHGGGGSVWLGYLIMVVALSVIFIGVKQHRDAALGGVIKFGPAFLLGLGIAIVASIAYVITWEVYLAFTNYAFMDEYTAGLIEAKRDAGVTGAALQAEIAKAEEMKAQYANPLFRTPMTFLEIFPVGLVIALISAALLRNPKLLPKRT